MKEKENLEQGHQIYLLLVMAKTNAFDKTSEHILYVLQDLIFSILSNFRSFFIFIRKNSECTFELMKDGT